MEARTSSREASIRAPSLSCLARSASATLSHWAKASALVSCAKMVRIMAATAARCLGAAWPKGLRAQCTRHRWRPAVRTRRAAARRPLWSSAMTSLTPRSPRSEELGPGHLGLGGAGGDAQDLAPAVGVDRHGGHGGDAGDPAALARLAVGGVDPEAGPAPLDRPAEEGPDAPADVRARARGPALRDAGAAHRLDRAVGRPGRDAADPPGPAARAGGQAPAS